jgi:hypothetical protein
VPPPPASFDGVYGPPPAAVAPAPAPPPGSPPPAVRPAPGPDERGPFAGPLVALYVTGKSPDPAVRALARDRELARDLRWDGARWEPVGRLHLLSPPWAVAAALAAHPPPCVVWVSGDRVMGVTDRPTAARVREDLRAVRRRGRTAGPIPTAREGPDVTEAGPDGRATARPDTGTPTPRPRGQRGTEDRCPE